MHEVCFQVGHAVRELSEPGFEAVERRGPGGGVLRVWGVMAGRGAGRRAERRRWAGSGEGAGTRLGVSIVHTCRGPGLQPQQAMQGRPLVKTCSQSLELVEVSLEAVTC